MNNNIKDITEYVNNKKKTIKIYHQPRYDYLEIELTSFCNMRCDRCNRLVESAPTQEMMTVDQIKKLVKESNELGYRWSDIRVMGGEPTLHPDIIEILQLLKSINNVGLVRIITNGTGEKVQSVLEKIRSLPIDIPISDSSVRYSKYKRINGKLRVLDYSNMLNAPIDMNINTIYSCQIGGTCGLALNRYGYTSCGCSAAIGRVANLDYFIKDLKDVTTKKCFEQLYIACSLCGGNMSHHVKLQNDDTISEVWKTILDNYNNKNELELY